MRVLFIILFAVFVSSCSDIESDNVDVTPTVTQVANAADGVLVRDPSAQIEGGEVPTISLSKGYFSFELEIANGSKYSLVLSSIGAEVLEFGNDEKVLGTFSYSARSIFIGSYPNQDPAGRYMMLVTNGGVSSIGVTPPSGGEEASNGNITQFYIDGLERDELTNYLYNVRLTLEGFFTDVNAVGGANPFDSDKGFFKKIVYFTVK